MNHLLLTVAKTGSATCRLSGCSAARFGEAQSVPPVIEGSKPQAVVTLAPGGWGCSPMRRAGLAGLNDVVANVAHRAEAEAYVVAEGRGAGPRTGPDSLNRSSGHFRGPPDEYVDEFQERLSFSISIGLAWPPGPGHGMCIGRAHASHGPGATAATDGQCGSGS
ncbi:DUF4232 domain-containing protein [Streptomyces sp. Mo3]|uniref:DUF4232 domain-containing protein n=1 Tax=Streptomyces sp. Mo3 TaxID=3161190 RepID=UPI0039EFDBA8